MPDRVAAIIIRSKRLLLVTGHGSDLYWTPGGKLEGHESLEVALKRALVEELSLHVQHI
jgi:ADP-ribose pyrophosphatase YjhB (NUDIX family)